MSAVANNSVGVICPLNTPARLPRRAPDCACGFAAPRCHTETDSVQLLCRKAPIPRRAVIILYRWRAHAGARPL